MDAVSVKNAMNSAMKKWATRSRPVYLRTVTHAAGGDELIGRYGTDTVTDTAFSIPPFVNFFTEDTVLKDGQKVLAGSYVIVISADAVTSAQLESPFNRLIFKDAGGNVEQLLVDSIKPVELTGVMVGYSVIARSVKR